MILKLEISCSRSINNNNSSNNDRKILKYIYICMYEEYEDK